jgi:RHS repeat-associated protein
MKPLETNDMNKKHAALEVIIALFALCSMAGLYADDRVISPGLGYQPAHAYALYNVESIDKATGSLALRIPLAQLPEGAAGFSAGLTLVYNNKYWEVEPFDSTYELAESFSGGWRLSMAPSLDVEYIASTGESDPCGYYITSELFQLRLTRPDGGRHTFMLSKPVRTMPTACEAGTYRMSQLKNQNAPSVWFTADGSFLRLEIDAPSTSGIWPYNSSWTLYSQDGSSVRYEVASRIIYLQDRNGNKVSITRTVDPLNPAHSYEVMADDFGRTIRLDHFGVDRDEVSQTGHNGTQMVWKVYYGYPGSMTPYAYRCDQSVTMGCTFNALPLLATRLELPNGLSYVFGYDRSFISGSNYRELRTLTLPTGAKIDYGYRLDSNPSPTNWFHILANPVTSKTVSVNGEMIERWEFNYEVNPSTGVYSRSTHKAPDGGITSYEFKPVTYKTGLQPDAGIITKIVNPDGSIVNRDWQNNYPREKPSSLLWANMWIRREWTTTANASGTPVATSVKVFTTDKNGNLTSQEERGWLPYSTALPDPSGALLMRKTVHDYLNGASDSTNMTVTDANAYSYAYLPSPSLPRNLPASVEVRDGAGVVKSRSQFSYTETDPARTVGNLTAEYRWDSTKPGYSEIGQGTELTAANSIVKRYEYTPRGNLRRETDFRNIATSYEYGGIAGCPQGGSTSVDLYRTAAHMGQEETGSLLNFSYAYNCLSGKTIFSSDPNSLPIYSDYDNYGRLTSVVESGYRKTTHVYSDTGLWIVTRNDVQVFNDQQGVSILHYDRLGRVRLARKLEGPVGSAEDAAADESTGIRSDTKYVFSYGRNETWVSNPYRNDDADASSRGWAVTRRDKAGRVCLEEWFAGASSPIVAADCTLSSGTTGAISHRYDAFFNSTLQETADAAGRTRRMYRDVLGRLVAVRTDPTSLKFDTYYQYSTLDALVAARHTGSCAASDPIAAPCAAGQTRVFGYDSLNRVTSASVPEMGGNTISYSYDENGNLTAKLASGNPSLLAAYSYDSLNRIKTRVYGDGVTPSVTYCYDGRTWSGGFGGCTGSPSAPSLGHVTGVGSLASQTAYVYDEAGRVTRSVQTTAGRSFAFDYSYDAGYHLISQTYPSGRKVATGYNALGQPKYSQGQYLGLVTEYAGNTGNGIRYAPHGGLSSMTLGNGIVETRNYNSRLQLTRLQAGELLTLWNCYHATDDPACSTLASAPGNSDEVQGQKIQRGPQSWLQKFSYDPSDRLTSAVEINGWQQTYGYDPYGNRWLSASSGLAVQNTMPTSSSSFAAATNRMVGANSYDWRGNLSIYGAYTLAYDGEDRIVSAGGVAPSMQYEYDGEGKRVRIHTCSASPVCMPGPGAETTLYVYDAFGRLAAEYSPRSASPGTSYFTLDQLGSTRLETDSSGRQIRCGDYTPFGEEIPSGTDGRGSCFAAGDNRIKFAGKERDIETGLDFSLARYYSGSQGRFTSPDPLNIPALQRIDSRTFAAIISNPQNWNGYAYARNNPFANSDPDGYLTIIVPGTFNNHGEWSNSKFQNQVEKTFGEKALVVENNFMLDTPEGRSSAAKQLSAIIEKHKFAPGEKLNIVAHSHGGNVVAEASRAGLNRKIDTLVTLGTPIRPDYSFNESRIGRHLNVFSNNDRVQKLGGMKFDVPGSVVPILIPAGRQLNVAGVKNLDATSQADGHSKLWTMPGTWDKIVAPEIRK